MSFRARRVATNRVVERYDWGAVSFETPPMVMPHIAAHNAATAHASAEPQLPHEPPPADEQAHFAALERDAFTKGYAQGERAGAEAAHTRGEAMLRRLTETLSELGTLRAEVIRRTERQTVQLALAISKRIVNREMSVDRGLILAMARVALDRLGEQASATIRLHPDDFAIVMSGQADVSSDHVHVVADPVVSRGGCLVQSDFGFMEVGIDAQFEELARTLLGEADLDPVPEKAHESHVLARA